MAMVMTHQSSSRDGGVDSFARAAPPPAMIIMAPQIATSVQTTTTTTTLPSSSPAGITVASFWEPGGYKPNLRRINDSNHLCNDFIALVNERADIEAKYASLLRKFSEKWNTLIDKGAEYGTMQSCWKSVLIACDRLAAVHAAMHEEMLNEVASGMKQWQKQNMIKQTLTRDLKFKREIEDEFKRAQKSWEKLLREVADTKADYFHCCQKEKSSIVRERNVARDQSVSVEQRQKYEDETHKLTESKQRAREKYARAVRELAYATPKYKDDMQRVFAKCQEREAARMDFFKQMFFKLHECLDLSARPQMPEIFSEFYLQIDKGDAEADLRWWDKTWGPAMPMVWPTEYEEYRDDANKNIIGNSSSNNKAKLANIVPLATSPLATPNKQPTQGFTAVEANSAAQNGISRSSSNSKTESLARQATALMNAVRVPGEAPSPGAAALQSSLPNSSSSSRPLTAPTANSGIALTSYQEHSEILPTVRCKPKQPRAQISGGRTLPWSTTDEEVGAALQQQYDIHASSRSKDKNKMRSAHSEYQLNNITADDDENDLRVRKLSHQQVTGGAQRRSRGSVAENSLSSYNQHQPSAATNGDVAARRSSVTVLSNQQQSKILSRGQTLPPAMVAALSASSSFSSSSKSENARQQRSSTLYYNPQQNNGETPPPTYDQPHQRHRSSLTSDENTTNDEETISSKNRREKTHTSGRAHAVGAIGHAAGKRYAYVDEENGPYRAVYGSASIDSSLERHFVDTSNGGEIETSATTTTEPYSNVIAEMHEKLNKSGQRAQYLPTRATNESESVPKNRRTSRSRSRSRAAASRDHSRQQQKSSRQASSSRDGAEIHTEKTPTLNVEKVQTTINDDVATSGNVRAKIKSFTSITKITNDSAVSTAKPTTASVNKQQLQKKTADEQHEPMAVSPESGAASSIDSSELLTTNVARTQNTPVVSSSTSAFALTAAASTTLNNNGGMKTFAARAQNLPLCSLSATNANNPVQSNSEWESESADSALDDHSTRRTGGGGEKTSTADIICMVKAIYDYNAEEADEISLRLGEVLAKIQHEDAQGWCKGRKLDGREGLFPASFVVDE